MFGDVVMEIAKTKFDAIFDAKKEEHGYEFDVDLTTEDLKEIIVGYKALVKEEMGRDFPQEPKDQLMEAIMAVFRSWNNDRAILYRQLNDIPDSIGTAVNVQSMVFGNMGEYFRYRCSLYKKRRSTVEKAMFGEFLVNAQGEDVVAGIRTPQPIAEMAQAFPEVYKEFIRIAELLEKHYRDMQDMEFTVEREQTLSCCRQETAKERLRLPLRSQLTCRAEGLIDKETAVMRIEPAQIDQLLHPMFDAEELKEAEKLTKGLPASPGAATGQIYFNASDAETAVANGAKAILVRLETSPEDLAGMVAAEGILTARGGMTSHAAVVARGMGKCCVSGCAEIKVDEEAKDTDYRRIRIQGRRLHLPRRYCR